MKVALWIRTLAMCQIMVRCGVGVNACAVGYNELGVDAF